MLTVDDVLSIRHPEPVQWSPDGASVAFVYIVDGVRELWVARRDGTAPVRVSAAGEVVSTHAWRADGRLLYTTGNRLLSVAGGQGEPCVVLEGNARVSGVAAAPGDTRVCVVRGDGALMVLEDGPVVRELPVPGRAQGVVWSPDGRRLAVSVLSEDDTRRDIAVLDATTGAVVWRTDAAAPELAPAFVGPDRITWLRLSPDSTWKAYLLADLAGGDERVMERVESAKGLSVAVGPVGASDGGAVAYTLPVDGWMHVVVHDLRTGTRTVALPGAHEDLGHEAEQPEFSPDGRSLAFSSSRGAIRQRQLWRYDLDTGKATALTDERGTHTDSVWSPDGQTVACIFGGPFHSAEVTLVAAGGGEKRRLTRSMPAAWTRDAIIEPTHVELTSADGMKVHADMWLPRDVAAGEKVPGLVYVHGGPTRQMRDGWHPMHPYAVFYAYNQYLASRGYAVISVDYRGGTGYGLDYEQANYLSMASGDMEDCIAAAEHLAAQPQVDPRRLAIWGLSYGGYMTLAALTKRPEVFALGINIAGLWDLEQWLDWIGTIHPGMPAYFARRCGGPLAEGGDAEAHRQASPRNFLDGLKGPLLNLMGTADANVDFTQFDAIIRDCTAAGKDFAALYYPDETHMFTKRTTWEDAFARIESAFERYLRCDPERRPAAMI